MNKKVKGYCDMMGFSYMKSGKQVAFYQKIGKNVEYTFAYIPIELIEDRPEIAIRMLSEIANDDPHVNIPTSGRFKWGED